MTQRAVFFDMATDEELLRRALAKTDEELEADLARIVEDLRRRCAENVGELRNEARAKELAAAERSLERVRKRLKR